MAVSIANVKTSLLQNAQLAQPDVVRNIFNITTIAAAGTTQATATAIGNESPIVNIPNNTAANGVILPTAAYIGQNISIFPLLVTTAPLVYPPVGGTINNGTVNAGVAITARKLALFIALDRTGLNWATLGV